MRKLVIRGMHYVRQRRWIPTHGLPIECNGHHRPWHLIMPRSKRPSVGTLTKRAARRVSRAVLIAVRGEFAHLPSEDWLVWKLNPFHKAGMGSTSPLADRSRSVKCLISTIRRPVAAPLQERAQLIGCRDGDRAVRRGWHDKDTLGSSIMNSDQREAYTNFTWLLQGTGSRITTRIASIQ